MKKMNKIEKRDLLKLAREQAELHGKARVQLLCEMVFGMSTKRHRRIVSLMLDEAGIPRIRQVRKPKPKPIPQEVLPQAWGQLMGITGPVVDCSFSEVATLDYPEVELYLAKQAKLGNRNAFTVLKDLIEA
jgi:hypothetical protein